MAEMIPQSISANSEATNGEKKVFRLLQDTLVPDEDFLVWYEPKVVDRYSDFLIFSQKFGLLVVEVKDWNINQITTFSPQTFKGNFYGQEKEVLNPLAQARDVANKIKGYLSKIPSLVHNEGEHKNKISFPIGHCVIFTNISRSQAESRVLLSNPQILGESQSIFSDDLSFDIDSKDECRNFITKLKNTFLVKYYFDPLSYDDLKSLRFAIFPEVRINVNKIRQLRSQKDEELLKTLDLEQEQTAKSMGAGHRILKGVAGSGKTLVLACRVKYLKQIHSDWKILIVCYNISLRQYLHQLIKYSGDQDKKYNDIHISHFHGLVKELTGANLSKLPDESDEDYDTRIGDILKGKIAEGTVKKGTYDAIFVDEGQDFATEWMQGLSQLLNEKTDSLLFCYDPAQNVFGRKRPNWKTAGFKVQGKRPTLLKKSYRNTVEILELATKFSKMDMQILASVENPIDETLFPEIATNRHGEAPILKTFSDDNDIITFILAEIDSYLKSGECDYSDIGILYTSGRTFPEAFINAFLEKNDHNNLYWVTRDRESKLNLDVSSKSIKLLTIESCKGLEFRVVFFVGLEYMPKNNRKESSQRSLAYVGMTRAQDMLYITSTSEAGYVGEVIPLIKSTSIK